MDHESTNPGAPQPGQKRPDDAQQASRERVSARMDGACPPPAHTDEDEDFAWLARDPDARDAWLDYHRIGDLLRSQPGAALRDERAFLNRFHERLAAEPVQIAPRRVEAPQACPAVRPGESPRRWSTWAGAAAAAVAGVAVVAALHAMGGAAGGTIGGGTGGAGGWGLPGWAGAGSRAASQVLAARGPAPAAPAVDAAGASAAPPQLAQGPMSGGPPRALSDAHGLDTRVSVPRALLAHLTCLPPLHRHDPARLRLLR